MEKEFVRHEISLELKQLGFDDPCIAFYNGRFLDFKIWNDDGREASQINVNMDVGQCPNAPTFSQVFRWFREKYELDSYIKPSLLGTKKVYDFYIWFTNKEGERDLFIGMNNEYTYEEAEIECLLKLIEFVKESI
jgi:hypothetical protein